MSEWGDFLREAREYGARVNRYYERQYQALQRQRMINGGYVDEELDDIDEEEAYGVI